jgi:hypothetical protein
VLLFGVLSLKVGSTKGLLMSSGHGGDQATEAKDYNTEAPKCYTTKAQELRFKLRCPELHNQSV